MSVFLVDNSVLQRVARSEQLMERLDVLTSHGHTLATCALSLDEAGYSARALGDLQQIQDRMTTQFGYLELTSDVDRITRDIRRALFRHGTGRGRCRRRALCRGRGQPRRRRPPL